MTKLLRSMIDAENKRRNKTYPQVGALTTYTRGFGLKTDCRVAVIMNSNGGVADACLANVRSFRKYLAANTSINGHSIRCFESPKGKNIEWDRWTIVYMDTLGKAVIGRPELYECVGMSGHSSAMYGPHLGNLVAFESIPESLQRVVIADCENAA